MHDTDHHKKHSDTSDDFKADTLGSMIKDFYNRKNAPVVVLVWLFALLSIAGAVASAVMFFKSEQVKSLILYAVLFLVCVHWVDLAKIFAWQVIHRNALSRRLKRLETRVNELNELLKPD
jgi:hypothetical protein